MKPAAHIFVVCVLLLAFASRGRAQRSDWNVIQGMVVDEANVAVVGAKVCVPDPVHGGPCTKSTVDGKFSLLVKWAGTYPLSAGDFNQGYPEPLFSNDQFYAKLIRPVNAIVNENSAFEPVKIVLGPRAGRLVVTILDGDTDKPIESGSVAHCRINEPTSCWSIMGPFPDGRYELLTPEVPFTIKFATWDGKLVDGKWVNGRWVERKAFDGESGKPIEVLQVDLGARKEITVRLR